MKKTAFVICSNDFPMEVLFLLEIDVVSRAAQIQIELDREDRAAGLLRWPGHRRYVHYQECQVIEKVEK